MICSVRVRIMLWFALMMAVVLALMTVFMAIVAKNSGGGNAERLLVNAVSYNVDELDYDNGKLDIDEFDVYRSGVFTQVFDEKGNLIAGAQTVRFDGDDVFVNATIRRVLVNGEEYLVLDQLADDPDGAVWFRGVTNAENTNDSIGVVARLGIILLPVLVGLTLLGGWFIASRAMRPVRRIAEAADAIGDGNDLSARIGLARGRDEIHRLAATFDRMFARLEQSFQSEKQFAADASHELRTPTAVILGECELAKRTAKTTADYAESLDVIERQANLMSRLIDQFLRAARLEQGTEHAEFFAQDVGALTATCCEDAVISDPNAQITTDIEPDITAEVDAALYLRLLQNLLDNAKKYGGEKIAVGLHRREGDALELTVHDNGGGIAEADKARIWQRFWRADDARTQGDGTGLGLYLVRQIAEAHGGSVTCESSAADGTDFIFRFYERLPVKAKIGTKLFNRL